VSRLRPMARLRGYLDGEDPKPAAAMFGLNAVDELDNATFIWLGPVIAESFGKGVGAFGVIGILVLVVAPLVAIPVSLVADRRARMPIALACAVMWGLFSLASAAAVTLTLLVLARIGSSLGRTVSYPVQLSLMADFYSPKVRAKALGVHAQANTVGAIVGALGAGAVGALFGWRAAFVALAVPTLVTILLVRRLPEPPRGAFERVETPEPLPVREVFPRLAAIRSQRYVWIAGIWVVGGGTLGSLLILPFYFKDTYGIGPFGVGVIGAVAGLGAMVSTFVGARIAQDRLNEAPRVGVRWIASVMFVACGMLGVLGLAPTLWVTIPLLFALFALFGLIAPLLAAVGTLIAPPELRSSAYAIGQIIWLLGAIPALIIALIAEEAGYGWAFAVAAAVMLRGVFHVLTVARYIDADVARRDPAHVDAAERTAEDGSVLLLETQGLTVSYDGVQVLFGVDLQIREGEIVALLGTNGAGKSTTLNAINGLVEPDGGNVWFDGVPITGEPPERTTARGIVQAPGGRGIFPGLTVEENLRLGAFLLRKDKALLASRLDEVLDVFPALRPLLGLRAGSLSGGQRQQLVLAQSFLLKPKLLLIDELSLGLAPVVVQELLATVRRLNREGVTIVLVEQSVNVALTLADRAYFMEKGQVRFEGPTAELLHRDDLLRSVFLGGGTDAALVTT
jgi:ABC-type branched-subunit amino acid transport system ATPase component/predicted MFS family arabinose efflux permease